MADENITTNAPEITADPVSPDETQPSPTPNVDPGQTTPEAAPAVTPEPIREPEPEPSVPRVSALNDIGPDHIDALLRDHNTPGDVRAFFSNVYAALTHLGRVRFEQDESGLTHVKPAEDRNA